MSRARFRLQQPPIGFLVRSRLELLAPVRWFRRWSRPRQADVFLLSFPKAGRTWLRVMLAKLLAEQFDLRGLESERFDGRTVLPGGVPRILAKHDGSPQKKTAGEIGADRREFAGCRVILLVRDPRDMAVSNYFQVTRREGSYQGDLSSYLREPRGSVDSMIRYYNVWARDRELPRDFMLLRYEDIHADPARELRRIASFIGLQQFGDDAIGRAVEHASFAAMKAREARRDADGSPLAAGRSGDLESFKTRRGKVGGYRDYLSDDDIAWLDRRIDRELDPFYGYRGGPASPTGGASN
ncbi:MAG TPA: sulfotransferase domain-containing protein [Steroidobacteraceae bacterium]|nr:sulfotransferase domain-containing protein [Steroidobacteraceae bacterium]